jgi:antitoxin MazE
VYQVYQYCIYYVYTMRKGCATMELNHLKGEINMTTTVQKWGNSLGVRIPQAIAERYAIEKGSEIEFDPTEQGVLLVPKKKKPTLSELLSQCKPENRHEYIDFGSVGKELF